MLLLILGLLLFIGAHSTGIVNHAWRERTLARLGLPLWQGGLGLIALTGLVLIVLGYGDGRTALDPIVLYQPPVWTRHLALLVMLPAFPLLFAAYLPGRIRSTTGHPMLLAVMLWAVAHLLANGLLIDLLLFGGLLAWAVADRLSLRHRPPQEVQGAAPGPYNDWIALGAGLVLYVLFLLLLHRWLFGVAPLG